MKKKITILFVTYFFMLCVSCDLPSKPQLPSDGGVTGGTAVESTELFKTDNSTNEIRIQTNDRKYLKPDGVTLWTTPNDEQSDFAPLKVSMKKKAGHAEAGYGVVFCEKNVTGFGNCLLTVLITVNGQYTIGKVIDGTYQTIQPWITTGKIAKGYERNNALKITYDKNTELFTLFINDVKECDFKDSIEPELQNGKSGYAVVISPHEIFPLNSVSVVFKKQP